MSQGIVPEEAKDQIRAAMEKGGPAGKAASGLVLASARRTCNIPIPRRSAQLLREIRELRNDPAAYAAELQRRWGVLLSYRCIGRKYASMDTGPVDNTVTLRRDMRNSTGGLLVAPLSISSPEGAVGSDRETVPNPVIHC